MSQTVWTELIQEVHHSGRQLVLAVTGGGSKAISQLLDVAGASNTILEATVPYASSSLESWLGAQPEQYCAEQTARQMAMAAWLRARRLAPDKPDSAHVGIGATASLASNRPKRGDHRVHVALQTHQQTASLSLTLEKDLRDRKKEQWLAAKLILLAVAESCALEVRPAAITLAGQLVKSETVERHEQLAEPAWTELLLQNRKLVAVANQASRHLSTTEQPQVVFPGAFNPLHAAHQRMAEIATEQLGQPTVYEISVTNVDKPALDFVEIQRRLASLQQQDTQAQLVLTDAPTFREKSALFPGCTFVVGADTLQRIADPQYYSGAADQCREAIKEIAQHGCRYLVFGRLQNGQFQEIKDLSLPQELLEICLPVPEDQFRIDLSSTELRKTAS